MGDIPVDRSGETPIALSQESRTGKIRIQMADASVMERVGLILRALPEWFGIESSTLQYIEDSAKWPTWFANIGNVDAGFITIRTHFKRASAEIHCLAVRPEAHRCGVGRALIEHGERLLRADGVRYLQVKTLGPSRQCEPYERTRRFYEAVGFIPVEEFMTLWPGNPALLLIKSI